MSSALKLEATVNSSALHIVQTKHRVAIPDDAHLFAVRQMQYARGLEEPPDRKVDLRTPKRSARRAGEGESGPPGEVRVSQAVVTVATPSFTFVQS